MVESQPSFSEWLAKFPYWMWVGIMAIAVGTLIFTKLDNAWFWDDEAHVGVMARNYLKMGHLTGWDGRQLYMYRNGGAIDSNLRPVNAPLDILVTAASFKVFGISTFTGRLPFAVFGLLSFLLFAAWLRMLLPDRPAVCYYSLGAFGFLPTLVLNSRCCRYNTLTLLATLVIFVSYSLALRRRQPLWFFALAAAATVSFYANPMNCAAAVLSVGVLYLVFDRKALDKRGWAILAAAIVLFLATTVPYALAYRIWDRPDHEEARKAMEGISFLQHRLTLLLWNLRDLSTVMMLPFWFALLAGFAWFVRGRDPGGQAATILKRALLLLVVNVLAISFVSPQPTNLPFWADVRYLVFVLPLTALIGGIGLEWLHRRAWYAAVPVFLLAVCTNIPALPVAHNWGVRVLMPHFIGRELARPFPTVASEISAFLANNAKQDDVVVCFPEHHMYPILFYMGDKIRISGLMTPSSHLDFKKLDAMGVKNFRMDDATPDWIFIAANPQVLENFVQVFSRPLRQEGRVVKASYSLLAMITVWGEQPQRPELFWHEFGAGVLANPEKDGILVIRRDSLVETDEQEVLLSH